MTDLRPTYIGVIIHLLSAMDIPVSSVLCSIRCNAKPFLTQPVGGLIQFVLNNKDSFQNICSSHLKLFRFHIKLNLFNNL